MPLYKLSSDGAYIWSSSWCDRFLGMDLVSDSIGAIYCAGLNYSGERLVVKLLDCPEPPTLNAITPDPSHDGNILLDWEEPYGSTTYYIYRQNECIIDVTGLTPIASVVSPSSYVDFNVTEGTYFYVIVAEGANGNSTVSNCESVVVKYPSGGILGFESVGIVLSLLVIIVIAHIRKQRKLL